LIIVCPIAFPVEQAGGRRIGFITKKSLLNEKLTCDSCINFSLSAMGARRVGV